MLSHFSHHQAAPSLGFSKQEHWSGLPFPSPVKSESEVAESCPTLSDPMDCNLPGSSVHGIFQARVLEWGAIAFSDTYSAVRAKWLQSYLTLCHPMVVALQAPLSMGFSGKEYWSGLPCSPPGDLPNTGIKPSSPVYPA